MLNDLLKELGYQESPFYREAMEDADISVAHLLRDARRAHVCGTYFIRTAGGETGMVRERPAVYVAEASSPAEARQVHKQLWNQGTTPFILVSLPDQVRVYTGFAYEENDETVGQVEGPLDGQNLSLQAIVKRLAFMSAASIDSGHIWRTKGKHLTKDTRVDRRLHSTLRRLSQQLVADYSLDHEVAHALIGRYLYLQYLHDRDILSDEWLGHVDVDPMAIFSGNATLNAFRRVTDKVDERFNGRIFPIDWRSSAAPRAEAFRTVARAFSGEDPTSGQMALCRPFDFSFIPIELISAIYEQFLHEEGKGAKEGAIYTSEPVADYLIAEVESLKRLEHRTKILDPCCGSGMFLVLAFRRLIEQELRRRKASRLLPEELREILTKNIFGVERNPEACLVTEFNLILTLLSYIDPPELHQHMDFKFPTLHNEQIFECDFFNDNSLFWKAGHRFDWIIGNPPWKELDPQDAQEQLTVNWVHEARESGQMPVARYRSSEAFSWRVCARLADGGMAGLITQATSLTNDQSAEFRKAFFTEVTVHRITNFSNLAYILFESADEPAATIVYSVDNASAQRTDILHVGPFVVNQVATIPDKSRRRRAPWVLSICESEIQTVAAAEAARGQAATWKRALWGNPRDRRGIERLRRILPITLEDLAKSRGWHLRLGLQLRPDPGGSVDRNQRVMEAKQSQGATASEATRFATWVSGLRVLEPKQPSKTKLRLSVPEEWLVPNRLGTFIRERGGNAGLDVIPAPHLFLWNDFAAFSEQDFIFRHPQVGLSAPLTDADWLRAVSVIWASSITPYLLVLDLSAGWGISRSTIDRGDARRMPMPNLDIDLVMRLADLHRRLAPAESEVNNRTDWQRQLDGEVASILKIPAQLILLAQEFNEFRLPLIKGKAPSNITEPPDARQLGTYARRLTAELDGFLEHQSRHHLVTVLRAPTGIISTIQLMNSGQTLEATVKKATRNEQKEVNAILHAAEQELAQWVYIRRSVRLFTRHKIYLCKPAYRLEWTETRALLDAADIIAEVAEARRRDA